jgi:ferric-dicitrate binding protein FerR (iron transport regulator)
LAAEDRKQGSCPWLDRVQDYLDERLHPTERVDFERHLPGCDACRGELDSWRRLQSELRAAAAVQPAALDRRAVAARLFDSGRRRWLAPALAGAAVAALLLALLWPWGASKPPAGEPADGAGQPAVAAPEAVATGDAATMRPRPAAAVQVTYLQGEVAGPHPAAGRWVAPLDEELRLEAGAVLALRPEPAVAVALLDGARARLRADGGWMVELQRGTLAARLGAERRVFRVRCAGTLLTALGTAFSLSASGNGPPRLVLAEGALRLRTADGGVEQLVAPVRARLGPAGLEAVERGLPVGPGPLDLMARLEQPADADLGTLQLSSRPQPARVLIDGEAIGATPLVLARPAGVLHLELRAPGLEPLRTELALAPGRILRRRLELVPPPAAHPRPAPRPVSEPRADLLAEARRLLADRELAAARRRIALHLEHHPDDPRGLLLRADALRLAGRERRALDGYLRVAALADDPRLAEAAQYQAGLLRLQVLDRPRAALETFVGLRREHPDGLLRQEVAFHLAECYLALADYRRALRALQDYLRLYPEGTRAVEARGLLDDLRAKGWQ